MIVLLTTNHFWIMKEVAKVPQNAEPAESGQAFTGSDKFSAFAINAIKIYLRYGGSKVTPEQEAERKTICAGDGAEIPSCTRYGILEIDLPGGAIKAPGCLECGCPTATKAPMYKYFSFAVMRIKKATCPLGKWPDIIKP